MRKNGIAVRPLRELDAHLFASVALQRMLLQIVPALNFALAMSGIKLRNHVLPLPIGLYCIFFDSLPTGLDVG